MSYAATILADAPTHYLRLGESSGTEAKDASGNALPGTYKGGPALGTGGLLTGDPDTAVTLGKAQFIERAHSALLNVGDVFTFEAWIKLSAVGGGVEHVVCFKTGGAGTTPKFSVNEEGKLRLRVPGFVNLAVGKTTLVAGTTYHVVATKNGATIKLYLNGVDDTGTTENRTCTNNSGTLRWGSEEGGAEENFNGVLDECAYYSVAISQARVEAHYAAGITGPKPPASVSVPVLTGGPRVGQNLSSSTGTWENEPTSFSYQWQRSATGVGSWSAIAGAAAPSYSLTSKDLGWFLRCVVTASNTGGSAEAASAASEAIGEPAPRPIPLPPESPHLTVVSIAEGGDGRGYNLTEEVEGLSYSNVNPGGDEVCTFTLRRKWYDDNPELARGNLLRIMGGVDVLWQGRLEESDRSADNTETIAVTAYGLGVRLKDGSFREIFIDTDLSKWGEPSTQRKINILSGAGREYGHTSISEASPQDAGASGPGFLIHIDAWLETPHPTAELWYFASGLDIGAVLYDFIVPKAAGSELLSHQMRITNDDLDTAALVVSSVYKNAAALQQQLFAGADGGKYAFLDFIWEALGSGTNAGDTWGYANVKVIGRHALELIGAWPRVGFTVDQMVNYILSLVEGVAARQIDPQTFVVEQAAYTDATTSHEDSIRDLNRFENCDWGTWGPRSPLDRSTSGYFDFTNADRTTQHWFVLRSEADAEDLHSETSTLYGKVDVVYTDEAGIERIVTVEADVPDLDAAGMTREYTLNIGQATTAIATAEGEAFLAIWGQFAPARGSFTVSQAVRHYRRGELPAVYLRADGSNVRIPDILPASTLFALDTTPDRRTTFPIKRVSVDCSGEKPAATVEVDQADDSLSVLQARSDLKTSLIPST